MFFPFQESPSKALLLHFSHLTTLSNYPECTKNFLFLIYLAQTCFLVYTKIELPFNSKHLKNLFYINV